MAGLSAVQPERRNHVRFPGPGLIAEIRGKHYDVLDISFGGIKVKGRVAAAGGLLTMAIRSAGGDGPVEVRGRVERVVGDLTAVSFSNRTDALNKLIAQRMAGRTPAMP